MKYDWEEMLDRLEEKDLIEFLPETLPEMDEVTRKRIEKRTLQKIREERNRFSRKQIVAVLICLVAVLGIAGREPIQAAFERLFYYLPGLVCMWMKKGIPFTKRKSSMENSRKMIFMCG